MYGEERGGCVFGKVAFMGNGGVGGGGCVGGMRLARARTATYSRDCKPQHLTGR